MDAKTLGMQPVHAGEWEYINGNRAAAKGITKRELFAAMAMQGYIARALPGEPAYWADLAVKCADALLAELAKEQP